MGGLIHSSQFLDGVVRVHLGRGERSVSEQFLDGIEVRPIVQQLCRQRVPEHMGSSQD